MTSRLSCLLYLACIFSPIAAHAFEDTVEQVSRSFEITYPNQQKEVVVVEWVATVKTSYTRHGRASTWNHPVDDRSCSWSSTGIVSRRAYFVSASGVRAPITDSLKVFNATNRDRRGPRNFIQAAGGYHTTCGDQMAKIQETHKASMTGMKGAVQDVVEGDATDAEKNLMALLKPVNILAVR